MLLSSMLRQQGYRRHTSLPFSEYLPGCDEQGQDQRYSLYTQDQKKALGKMQ